MLATPDDRGRIVRPFRPTFLLMLRVNLSGRRHSALPYSVCRRGLARCGWHPRVWIATGLLVLLFIPAPAILAGPVLNLFKPARPSGIAAYAVGGLMGLVLGSSVFLIVAQYPRLAWRRWVDEVAGSGHCASCGQPLAGLPVADDGCRVCPECGAAWGPHPPSGYRRPAGSGW